MGTLTLGCDMDLPSVPDSARCPPPPFSPSPGAQRHPTGCRSWPYRGPRSLWVSAKCQTLSLFPRPLHIAHARCYPPCLAKHFLSRGWLVQVSTVC